jgi:hypothetical protein
MSALKIKAIVFCSSSDSFSLCLFDISLWSKMYRLFVLGDANSSLACFPKCLPQKHESFRQMMLQQVDSHVCTLGSMDLIFVKMTLTQVIFDWH